jgi:hypothetical protein
MNAHVDFARSASPLPQPAPWRDAPVLLLTAVDKGYLGHAIALARSLDQHASGQHLLVHLVNPDAESLARLQRCAGGLRSLVLHVSSEKVRLPATVSKAAYYASARFLRMAELLAGDDAVPVLALDADALAVGPLTLDFSDKPETEVCLRRRRVAGAPARHLEVAAGAVWARPVPRARDFMGAVADDLQAAFACGDAQWFIDQEVLGRHVDAGTADAKVRNLKSKFADWNMGEDAVFWMGKGERKYRDLRYLLARGGHDEDPVRRRDALRLAQAYADAVPETQQDPQVMQAARAARARTGTQVALFLPRLDLPWKRSGLDREGRPAALAEDTVDVRLWWKRFAIAASNTLERLGVQARTLELPAWEITPERVDAEGVDLALVGHQSQARFHGHATPTWFFMQEYFRPLFVLDPLGWGAGSSVYPVAADALPPAVLGAWDEYRAAFLEGRLPSKFAQAGRDAWPQLVARRDLPEQPYLFMPIQIPDDRVVLDFSEVGMLDALHAALALARQDGCRLVLKAHPANPAATAALAAELDDPCVHWTRAHVHDVLTHARGVVTVNSGVGFEALLANRPLVCLGRCEYDAVAHAATPATLGEAWRRACAEPDAEREQRYARFVDWFLARHAVDLSRPRQSDPVLRRQLQRALAQVQGTPLAAGAVA